MKIFKSQTVLQKHVLAYVMDSGWKRDNEQQAANGIPQSNRETVTPNVLQHKRSITDPSATMT
jgi:hypothetical protein